MRFRSRGFGGFGEFGGFGAQGLGIYGPHRVLSHFGDFPPGAEKRPVFSSRGPMGSGTDRMPELRAARNHEGEKCKTNLQPDSAIPTNRLLTGPVPATTPALASKERHNPPRL